MAGKWVVETASDAPSGKRVLVQRAVKHTFNVIVAPSSPYTDVDISVRFKPMAGREAASQVGLWTKADSVTAFADLVVRGVRAGG